MTETATFEHDLAAAEHLHRQCRYAEAESLYRKTKSSAEHVLGADSPLVQSLAEKMARLYFTLCEIDKAAYLLKQLRASKERSHGAHHPEVARIVRKQGRARAKEGRQTEADTFFAHALDIWIDHLGPAPAQQSTDVHEFDALYGVRSRIGSAERIYDAVLRSGTASGSGNLIAEHLGEMAILLRARGAKTLALQLFQFACRSLQNLPPEVIWSHSEIIAETGNLLIECHRFAEAESFTGGYLQFFDKAFGKQHDLVPVLAPLLGIACHKQNSTAHAADHLRRAVSMQEQVLDRSHPALADTLSELSGVYLCQGNYDEAESLLRRALSIRENSVGYEHLEVAQTLCRLGDVLLHRQDMPAAEQAFQRAVRIYEHAFGNQSEQVGPILDKIAKAYLSQSKFHKAESVLLRSLELKQVCLPDDHLDQAVVMQQLARLYIYWGKPIEAEGYYKRAIEILEKRDCPQLVSLVAELRGELADVYRGQCRHIECEKLLKRAIENCEDSRLTKPEDIPPLKNCLTELCIQTGKLREAGRYCLDVVESCRDNPAPFQRNQLARALTNEARIKALSGDSRGAETCLLSALRSAVPGSAESIAAQIALIKFCLDQDRLSDANQLLEHCLMECRERPRTDTVELADFLQLEAELKLQTHLDSALPVIKRIINIREQWQGNNHPLYAQTMILLARYYCACNLTGVAEEYYLKALQNMERSLGQYHFDLARTLLLLALSQFNLDKLADAMALIKRALRIWDRVAPVPDLLLLQTLCDLISLPHFNAGSDQYKIMKLAGGTITEERRLLETLLALISPSLGLFGQRAVKMLCRLCSKLIDSGQPAKALPVIQTLMELLCALQDSELLRESSAELAQLAQDAEQKAPDVVGVIRRSIA